MTSPSVQAIISSDPNIPTTSEPSIKAVKKSSKWLQIMMSILVLFALAALLLTIILFIKETESIKHDAELQEALALEIRRVNAIQMQSDDETTAEIIDDDAKIFLSLFSTPAGADVYKDGLFLGTTPIDQRKINKSDSNAEFVFVMEGYEIERKTISLSENSSAAITLEKIITQQPTVAHAQQNDDAVTQNKGVILTATTAETPKKSTKKGKSKKPTTNNPAPVAMDIEIPD